MGSSKCSAKHRASLQLIPPTTLHHWIKAADTLTAADRFLAKGEIGPSTMDSSRTKTGATMEPEVIFSGGRRQVTSSGMLNAATSSIFSGSPYSARGSSTSLWGDTDSLEERVRGWLLERWLHCCFFLCYQHGWLSHSSSMGVSKLTH